MSIRAVAVQHGAFVASRCSAELRRAVKQERAREHGAGRDGDRKRVVRRGRRLRRDERRARRRARGRRSTGTRRAFRWRRGRNSGGYLRRKSGRRRGRNQGGRHRRMRGGPQRRKWYRVERGRRRGRRRLAVAKVPVAFSDVAAGIAPPVSAHTHWAGAGVSFPDDRSKGVVALRFCCPGDRSRDQESVHEVHDEGITKAPCLDRYTTSRKHAYGASSQS